MPFVKDDYLKDIIYRLAVIRFELTSNNSLGRYNSNKYAEDFFCGLLNLIFGWHLININHIERDAAGIDLIDTKNKIAIQVSSTAKHDKIQESIDFLDTKYPHMNNCHFYMMVITTKQSKYLKSFNKKHIQFDKERDIWDIDDLLREIQKLPIEKIEQISAYIEKECGLLSLSLDPDGGGNQITMSKTELENNPYLFICYCHQDRAKVFPILQKFKDAGMRYWYDDNLEPGVNYVEKIELAIDYCQGAIVFLTNNAVESEWCRNEILYCLNEKSGCVIPVYLEHVNLKYGLRLRLKNIEYYDISNESVQLNNIDQLINTLKMKLPEAFIQNRKQKDHLHNFYLDPHKDIVITAAVFPYFTADNIKESFKEKKVFRLALPDVDTFSHLSGFSDNDCGAEGFIELISKYSLTDKLEQVRIDVARSFLKRSAGNYFNGKMYGVYQMDDFARTQDAKEEPILSVEFYETDYFTHKITEELMKRISLSGIENKGLPSLFNDDLFKWTRTSFGVSVIVILPRQNEIIITKRSSNSAYADGKEWIYVSVTETLSTTDYNIETGCPDLPMCVFRGCEEELGISQPQLKQDTLRFYDAFYETHFHQDNIVVSVEVSDTLTFSDVYSFLAKDKKLEVADMFTISNEKKSIQSFIDANRNSMRSQTIFSLESYIAHMK